MNSSIGKRIIDRLEQFKQDRQSGIDISKKYTIHRYEVAAGGNGVGSKAIKKLRKALKADQAQFAAFLGVDVQTVRAWEKGLSQPDPTATRFMQEIQQQPALFRARLQKLALAQ